MGLLYAPYECWRFRDAVGFRLYRCTKWCGQNRNDVRLERIENDKIFQYNDLKSFFEVINVSDVKTSKPVKTSRSVKTNFTVHVKEGKPDKDVFLNTQTNTKESDAKNGGTTGTNP